jgi:glycosyltransferase involved in cell wall biosynthesis
MYKKPKILLITGIYPLFKGGAEYQMRLIADQLKDEYEIVFLYLGDVPGEPVNRTHSEVVDNYKVYFIQTCSKWDSLFLRYQYSRRIYNVIKKERPDFVYQRVLKFISYYISKFQKNLNYKHFIHIADLFTLEFGNESFRDKLNYFFFKKTVKNNPSFVVQTSEQSARLQEYGISPVLHIYNMHPSQHLDISTISTEKTLKQPKYIVWVANIKPIKQLEIFIDLAETYLKRSDLHFIVIGNLQDHSYGSPIVEKMKHMSNITHFVDKDNTFVNQYILDNATLVVNTSKSEGFSNVFIQSWLRGIPVLSLNSNPDSLFDKYTALGTYCANDTVKLQEEVNELLNEDTYVFRAQQCYNTAMDLFTFSNIGRLKELLRK